MKRKAYSAALLSVLLILALAGTLFISLAASDAVVYIVVDSPVDGALYSYNNVRFKYQVIYVKPSSPYINIGPIHVESFLDGKCACAYGGYPLVDTTLKGLSNGEHLLKIYAEVEYTGLVPQPSYSDSAVVKFTVNTGVAPSVHVVCFHEYKTSAITLNITTDTPDSTVSYSLDGQANVTLPKTSVAQHYGRYQYSIALSDLADGSHTLTAYAMDAMGNTGVSEKTFTVKTKETQPTVEPTPDPEPNGVFPTMLVAVAVAVIVAAFVSIGLLVYFRKIRKTTGKVEIISEGVR